MKSKLSRDELHKAVRWVESYVFAVQFVQSQRTHNKTFMNFNKALDREKFLESLEAHFLLLPSYRRFPNDEISSRIKTT